MNLSSHDVVTHIENELRVQRVQLARLTDRVEALRDLRAALFELTQRTGRALLTADEMWDAARGDETERALLTALLARALPTEE